jgi:3-carboxy-cis,cis-muconate cycloisomerase
MSLYALNFYTNELNKFFDEESLIGYLLKFESSLAIAQAEAKLIPEESAVIIENSCNCDNIDISSLKNAIRAEGNVAIPLVKQLTSHIKKIDVQASKYIHLGATSQDVIDTAHSLLLKDYLNWMDIKINEVINILKSNSLKYQSTPMMGRTLYQHAKVITFGVKNAKWLEPFLEIRVRLDEAKKRALVLTLGGAVGIGNQFITDEVKKKMALAFGLNNDKNKASFIEIASVIGQLNQELCKIAKDIILLSQTEIGELVEGREEGNGGSSTMPHKRNPVLSTTILANGERMPGLIANIYATIPQENERSAGLWHAQWELFPEILKLTGGTIENTIQLLKGLIVNEEKMKSNIDLTNGLVFAENIMFLLAEEIGKEEAHKKMQLACDISIDKNVSLKRVLTEMDIKEELIEKGFSYNSDLKYCRKFIANVIDRI